MGKICNRHSRMIRFARPIINFVCKNLEKREEDLTFLLSDFCSTGLNNLGTFSVFRLIGNIKKHAILDPFTHSNLAGLIDMLLLLFINYNVFN